MKKFLLTAILLLSSLTLAGCTPGRSNNPDISDSITNQEQDVDLVIDAAHMRYSPSLIEVDAGSTITIRINSIDEIHDFVIDELNVDSGLIGGGRSTVITMTIPEDAKGKTFEFYCSVGSHRAMGMVGSLVVK